MATLGKRNNRRYVQWLDRSGTRKTVSLGKIGHQLAEEIRRCVAALEQALLTGTAPPRKVAEWVSELGEVLHAKLAAGGLFPPREQRRPTGLAAFLDSYIAGRTDISQRSRTNLEQARNALVSHFGKDADLATLTKGQMKDWRRRMLETLSEATVS